MMEKKFDEICEILKSNGFWNYECYPHPYGLPVVGIEICNGDWKHDHDRLDYVLKECGYVKMGESLTEEDGSDVYSSIHYFA